MESSKQISAAMAQAFAEITGAEKDKNNAHLGYKYASLSSIIDAIKPSITKYGLWFYQQIHAVQGFAAVETVIVHNSGETLQCGIINVPVQKNDAQGYGSALTYARKYSLSAAFGVAPDDDDDGEEACKTSSAKRQEKKVEKIDDVPKTVQSARLSDEEFTGFVDKLAALYPLSTKKDKIREWISRGRDTLPKEKLVPKMEKWLQEPDSFLTQYNTFVQSSAT